MNRTQARNTIADFFQDYGAQRYTNDKEMFISIALQERNDIELLEKQTNELHFGIEFLTKNAQKLENCGKDYFDGRDTVEISRGFAIKLVRLSRKLTEHRERLKKMFDQNRHNFKKWGLD